MGLRPPLDPDSRSSGSLVLVRGDSLREARVEPFFFSHIVRHKQPTKFASVIYRSSPKFRISHGWDS